MAALGRPAFHNLPPSALNAKRVRLRAAILQVVTSSCWSCRHRRGFAGKPRTRRFASTRDTYHIGGRTEPRTSSRFVWRIHCPKPSSSKSETYEQHGNTNIQNHVGKRIGKSTLAKSRAVPRPGWIKDTVRATSAKHAGPATCVTDYTIFKMSDITSVAGPLCRITVIS